MPDILVIGDQPERLALAEETLQRRGHDFEVVADVDDGLRSLLECGARLVVICLPLRTASSREVLEMLRAAAPALPLVVVGRDGQIEGAPEALEFGASDYIPDLEREPEGFLIAIGLALGKRQGDAEVRYHRRRLATDARWGGIVGESPVVVAMLEEIRQVCHMTAEGWAPAILITGETGTGKGLVARAIHINGGRRVRPLVEVNCASLPPTLIESELFGHERGAFTGAAGTRIGLFETANRGTLFLDEISTLPLELQAKLLRVLEDKTIRRVGSSESIEVDVHVIAAANVDLAVAARRGDFREDLYHRLSVFNVELPPLRERGDDIVLLAESFLSRLTSRHDLELPNFTDAARAAMLNYRWPGNVRELQNRVERALLLSQGEPIDAQALDLADAVVGNAAIGVEAGRIVVELSERACSLDALERAIIEAALEKNERNVSRTARFLRISRQKLISRMRRHGLRPPRGKSS